jgi:hypothetical protein
LTVLEPSGRLIEDDHAPPFDTLAEATPESESLALAVTATGDTYQPFDPLVPLMTMFAVGG